MSLPELMKELGQARAKAQSAYKAYKTYKDAEDVARANLEAELRAEGLRSAKNDDYIVSIVSRPQVHVIDERAAIHWIEENPSLEADLYIGLKKTAFDGLVRLALKTDGELVPGTEIDNNEYLSIKEVKEK